MPSNKTFGAGERRSGARGSRSKDVGRALSVMSCKSVCFALVSWLAGAACVGHPPPPGEAERPVSLADLSTPPVDETIRLTLDSGTLPRWRLDDSHGKSEVTREVRLVKGRSIQLLLLADRECSLEIPAMRVRVATIPDRYQSAWFTPVEPGEYEIFVRSGTEQYDGRLIVTDKTP